MILDPWVWDINSTEQVVKLKVVTLFCFWRQKMRVRKYIL